jgi:hypothetical protein
MINKLAVITQLERIANNRKGENLTHHEILVIAHGILSVLDDVSGIEPHWRDEIELYLRMLTKCAPHHARSLQAEQCISYLRRGDESKKSQHQGTMNPDEPMSPDNF